MRRDQNVKISQKRTGVKSAKKKVERLVCRRILKDSKDVAAKSKPLKVYSAPHTGEQKQTIIKTSKTKTKNPPKNSHQKTTNQRQQQQKTPTTKRGKCQSLHFR